MRIWLKANGGPPAVVLVGAGLLALYRPLGIAVIVIGALMWAYSFKPIQQRIPFQVVRTSQLQKSRLSDEAFGKRCLEMAQRLQDMLGESTRRNPRILKWALEEMRGGNWDAMQKEENQHRAEIEGRFTERYRGECAWLLAEAHRRGHIDEHGAWPAWSPFHGLMGSSHDIPRIAETLATIGHRLTEKDDD
jgi:hypothetical protein